MKYITFLLYCISTQATAQKIEILLIGVSHNYKNYVQQDYSGIHKKIKQFKPTAFFGEFLSKQDEEDLMDYWCKQDNLKRLEKLRSNRNIPSHHLQRSIDSLKKQRFTSPLDYKLKTDLAHAYYLNQDVSNAHYQAWQVFEYLRNSPDANLENYVNNILSPQSDTTGRSMKRLKTSEYAVIAFPMMQEMSIEELQPMDSQEYDLNWSASSMAFYNKFEKLKNESLSAEMKTMLVRRDKGFEKFAAIEKESKNVTEWLNSNEGAAIAASGDFYFSEMYDLKDFPKEEMLSQLHWWLMRNRKMCENVVTRAKGMGAKKVVVIAGANHRKFMQEIFEKMQGVDVKNINQIELK